MAHTITDLDLKVTGTLPNAANTTSTNVVDLGQTTPFPITEKISVKISHTDATSANTLNLNIRLMESDEAAANFTNVAQLANPVLRTLGVSTSYTAANVVIALPPNVKRYIRATALGQANGGDASDGTFALEVLT
jgi:hypothetical protein